MAEYIERKALIKFVRKYTPTINGESTMQCVVRAIKEAPAANDIEKITRCKNCKYTETIVCPITGTEALFCEYTIEPVAVEPTHYCSYGERRKRKNDT